MMNIGTGSPNATLPSYLIQCNDWHASGDHGSRTGDGHRQLRRYWQVQSPGHARFGRDARRTSTNGSSATLMDVVNFCDQCFNMLLTDQEKADLVAFMNTLLGDGHGTVV